MKSLDQLIEDLKSAHDSDAGPTIIQHITADIMRIIYEDSPESLKRYEVREFYNPFSGKSTQEIISLLNSMQLTTMENKVLYVHLNEIFDSLEMENKNTNIYDMNRDKLNLLIDTKIKEIIEKIKSEMPEPTLNLGG